MSVRSQRPGKFRLHALITLLLSITMLAAGCSGSDENNNANNDNNHAHEDVGHDADPGDDVDDVDDADDSDTDLTDTGEQDSGDTDIDPPDTTPELPDFEWPAPTAPIELQPHESWKSRIDYWEDPFIVGDYMEVRWVKFSVLMGDPGYVIFQNSATYPFHYHFATERLAPFQGMSHNDFDAISLYEQDQEIILGAVLFPPQQRTNEIGIQLVRQDEYHPEMVKIIHDLVKNSIDAREPITPFYFPAYEQVPSTVYWADAYQERNITVSSVDRWIEGNSCYSPGWAYGRLVHVDSENIDAAYRDGTLTSSDILLTDGVPAEIPHLAGVISLSPGVPNSHVAILASSFNIPYVYLRTEADRQQALELVDQHIILRARPGFSGTQNCAIKLADAENLPIDVVDELQNAKKVTPISYPAKQPAGHYAVPTDALMPEDSSFYGGKAANFGMIRRAVPNNTPLPTPMAFSFDLWDEFLDQTLASGKTLRAEIAERLAPFSTYPPQIDALDDTLKEIRNIFKDDTEFTQAQIDGILDALSDFDDLTRTRFRSSTNVEDSEHFTGAGLYESSTGCKADDLDDDDTGPSLCDPDRATERGIFRAIRHTFASFYNLNAYLERLRHGVDESEVGMAMLVHYSDPDPTEIANGVVTVSVNGASANLTIVTQPGAASVTNPSDNARPEIVTAQALSIGTYFELVQRSELLTVGQTTLQWEDEYQELAGYIMAVVQEFKAAHPSKSRFLLDLEYKKLEPGKIIIRQVREIPRIDSNAQTTPILINLPRKLCAAQGESSNVAGIHRNKMQWLLNMNSVVLTPENRDQNQIQDISGGMLVDADIISMQGSPATWQDAAFDSDEQNTINYWSYGQGAQKRDYALRINIPTQVRMQDSPIVFTSDFWLSLHTTYATPQPRIEYFGGLQSTTEDTVLLTDCTHDLQLDNTFIPREALVPFGANITATTSYWWPPAPTGITAGYTAPLVRFDQTVIEGIGDAPITLTDYYAQTYRPQHHNFSEDFYFDFLLEPTLSAEVLAELQALDIRALVHTANGSYFVGFDGNFRPANAVTE